MTTESTSRTVKIVNRWNSERVLFQWEAPNGLESGLWMRHALEAANLRGANLGAFRTDFWDILLRAPAEIAGLRAALVEGRVDGSTYSGECACLVGTIANVRHVNHESLGNGISPNSSRPAEQWFMSINRGDTPESNQISKITVEWLDEFTALLALAVNATRAGVAT